MDLTDVPEQLDVMNAALTGMSVLSYYNRKVTVAPLRKTNQRGTAPRGRPSLCMRL